MGGGSNLLPNYISDGMFAWYDGEHNAGFGRHDNQATSWLNLANHDERITDLDGSLFSWGSNYLLPSVDCSAGIIPPYEPVTTECVLTINGTNYICAIAFNGNYWISLRANNTINFYNAARSVAALRGSMMSVSCVNPSNPSAIYVNGLKGSIVNGGNLGNWKRNCFCSKNNYGSGSANFYCIRLYNRALTQEEVLHNYEIDRQRFNL